MDTFPAQIASKLEKHSDQRVRNLVSEAPGLNIIAELLALYLDAEDEFDFRYLASGRSGAVVLLVYFLDGLAVVVKCGEKSIIEREQKNYEASRVSRKIPTPTRPILDSVKCLHNHALLAYQWAGGYSEVQTLRQAFKSKEFGAAALANVISKLRGDLISWHSVRKMTTLPFDQWQWQPQALQALKEVLTQRKDSRAGAVIAALENQDKWRDALRTKNSSGGTCHGDLNCDNIMIAKTNVGNLPTLIDFASVCKDVSPARDWAQLERDIKFRCLSQECADSDEFEGLLQQVDGAVGLQSVAEVSDQRATKVVKIVKAIRSGCIELLSGHSNIAEVEYAYFAFCWTLQYLCSKEYREKHQSFTAAIVASALRAYDEVEARVEAVSVVEDLGTVERFEDLPSLRERKPGSGGSSQEER